MTNESPWFMSHRYKRHLFFWLILVICTIYATLRYVVFKGVSPSNFPLYIANKILSWTGITLIVISFLIKNQRDVSAKSDNLKRWAGITGFTLIVLHIFMSLIILTPAYFPKFFVADKLSFLAESSMLMGVLAFVAFGFTAYSSANDKCTTLEPDVLKSRLQIGYFGLIGTAAHTSLMGYSSWMDIHSWPGYMPPITLLSTIIALIPLLLKILKKINAHAITKNSHP